MKKIKIFVSLILFVSLSFTCIGYATVSEELTITGTAQYELAHIINYLFVSDADISGATSSDKVGTMDGSTDLTNQFAWVMLTLDFTSANTKTVNVELTNASAVRLGYYKYELSCNTSQYTAADFTTSLSGITIDIHSGGYDESTKLVGVPSEYQNSTNSYVIQSGDTYSGGSVTISSDVGAVVDVSLKFYYAPFSEEDQGELEGEETINAASDKLTDVLNSIAGAPKTYDQLIQQMKDASYQDDYVGNVVGAGDSDEEFVNAVFGETLNSVSFNGAEGRPCTVMIKKEDITSTFSGDEIVLYLTTDDPSNPQNVTSSGFFGTKYIEVFAIVYVYNPTTEEWSRYGDVYRGEAYTNNYNGIGFGNNSFNTDSWRLLDNQTFMTLESDGTIKRYTVSDNSNIDRCITQYNARK